MMLDVRQLISTGPSLTAQERRPSQEQIKGAQERLKAAGHDPGSVDGGVGPQTDAAVRAYQQHYGLPSLASWMRPRSTRWDLTTAQRPPASRPGVVPDAVQEAQTPRTVPDERPEQRKSAHDRSNVFQASQGLPPRKRCPISPTRGRSWVLTSPVTLNAKRPMQPFEEIMHADAQAKPQVMAAQRQLLERRYDLTPRLDPEAKMSRGKPPSGRADRAAGSGTDWNTLAGMTPDAIRQRNLFRIRRCHTEAGGGRAGLSGDADCHVPPARAL